MNLANRRKLDTARFVRELQEDLNRAFCRSFVNERLSNLCEVEYAVEKKERVNV